MTVHDSSPGAARTIGLGCMRLSTSAERDDDRSVAVIHAALDAGATLLDSSNAYCLDDRDAGHNERLVARALASWSGDRSTIEVATKGGLVRPGGRWLPDGKARSLRAACEASRRALGVESIDLYLLHAVDPRTPFETSVRALASLQADGVVRRVGLCNVTVGQIESARRIVDIAAVQVSLSPFDDENLRNGVAEYCRDHGIRVIAYRPLGGDRVGKLARNPIVQRVAERHGASGAEVILAWLTGLAPYVTPIPGATRVETASSIARALTVRLDDADREALDTRFAGRLLRVPRRDRRPLDDADGEVVVVMGMPGAGKSTIARDLVTAGYERLNRDERGGALSDLVAAMRDGLSSGSRRWVLDNTYPTRAMRNAVIEAAWTHGASVRCVWAHTNPADAQINAITRLIEVHGSLPTPEEIRERGRHDTRYLGPDALFRYERTLEPPVPDEGFTRIEVRDFVRAPTRGTGRAIILDADDLLAAAPAGESSGAGPTRGVDPYRRAVLERYAAAGWLLFAHAWRPEVARGRRSWADVEAELAAMRAAFAADITFACCPHDAGPPICWCRKPLPGSVLEFALARGVALERSILVGNSAADHTLAQRLATAHTSPADFFSEP